MNQLNLTVGDTKPTVCRWPGVNLSSCLVLLQVAYPTPLAKYAVVTDPVNGVFELRWSAGELLPGEWVADFVITDAAGKDVTTGKFTLSIEGRAA